MNSAWLDAGVILLIILINGFFSMSEMAVVSSRKSRLKAKAEEGRRSYKAVLKILEAPSAFLSTIQLGITLIGVFAGAFGGTTIAANIGTAIARVPRLAPYARSIGLGIVVLLITFVQIVIGELVPKQIALSRPESIAAGVIRPLRAIQIVFTPIVKVLSFTTGLILKVMGVRERHDHSVTEEEIRVLIREGTREGLFGESEQELVENVFYLGDRRLGSFMTHRSDLVWLDRSSTPGDIIALILENDEQECFPVCEGGTDDAVGVVQSRKALLAKTRGGFNRLDDVMDPPFLLPESFTAIKALEAFKSSKEAFAFVVDEYGGIEGILTIKDIVEDILGETAMASKPDEPSIIARGENGWLVDGMYDFRDFVEAIGAVPIIVPGHEYHTVAGYILRMSGIIPKAGDSFVWNDISFEIMDMDGRRIDKVLVTTKKEEEAFHSEETH
ncbi:MAG: hemolysin family protein [Spirochaetes bacterium]|nr:hemolysin family protein [Spirochaetota bacterium]